MIHDQELETKARKANVKYKLKPKELNKKIQFFILG